MSEIMEIHSMSPTVEHSVGKVERDNKHIVKETVVKETNVTEKNTGEKVQKPGEKQNENKEESNLKMIRSAVDTINESMKEKHTSIRMKYHDKLNRITIKIVDDNTDEVIKEIPPEETLDMIQKMLEQAGIIVDERR